MGRFTLVLVLFQIGAAFIPFWLFEIGQIGFESAALLMLAWVAGYVAVLTGEVTSVREAAR